MVLPPTCQDSSAGTLVILDSLASPGILGIQEVRVSLVIQDFLGSVEPLVIQDFLELVVTPDTVVSLDTQESLVIVGILVSLVFRVTRDTVVILGPRGLLDTQDIVVLVHPATLATLGWGHLVILDILGRLPLADIQDTVARQELVGTQDIRVLVCPDILDIQE